jgi:acetone carboxylase gamma subunit
LSTLEGATGKINVKIDRKEKFVTKSEDGQAFADLSHLAREWQLDDYFVLDTHALMKELYQKKRLSTKQLETLKRYVLEKEESRVTVKLSQDVQEDGE